MKKLLAETANKIKTYCREWNLQFEQISPNSIIKRKQTFLEYRQILKCILSIFITPKHDFSDNIYIFSRVKR